MTIQEKVSLGRYAYPSRDESIGERDRLLVEAHLRHDADAFAIIVEDHRDALIAQARRQLGPDGAAEDVVQETFERALRYIHRFGRSGDYRLGAWLNSILKNVVHDHRERLVREWQATRASMTHVPPEADVADKVGDPVMAAELHQAVLDLPPHHRAAFIMREVEGLPYADVAHVLNISEDNVRARVSRSKGQLRRVTRDLRSAAGALLAIPGLRVIQARLAKFVHRDKHHHVLGAGDRVATQITSSPVAQGAITLVSNVPRGSFVFGIAATVATLGATTLVVAGTGGSSHPVLASASAPAAQRAPATVPLPTPATGAGPSTTTAGSGASGAASTTSYAWANPGSGSTGASGASVAGLSAGSCVSSNGVAAPGAGFNYGTPLGLANAQAVADTPAVDLPTTGPSLSFNAPATITPYGSSVATDTATLATDVCLSSAGSWFTAVLTDDSGSQVQLQGSLQQVIGSGDNLGYVFRGTLNPTPAGSGPLAGAVQFVVDVAVAEPDNTAQLTMLFLGTTAETGPPNGQIPTTTSQPEPTTSAPTTTSPTTPSPMSGGVAPTGVPPSSQSSPGSAGSTGSGNGAFVGGSTQAGAGGSAAPPMLS